jgi:hypothetical protein
MARSFRMMACALLLAGCNRDSGGNPVFQERIDLTIEAAALLETVKDEASAHAAAAPADHIAVRLRANRSEMERLGQAGMWREPTQEQIMQHAEASKRYSAALFRIPNVRGTKFIRRLTLAMQRIEIIKDLPERVP